MHKSDRNITTKRRHPIFYYGFGAVCISKLCFIHHYFCDNQVHTDYRNWYEKSHCITSGLKLKTNLFTIHKEN